MFTTFKKSDDQILVSSLYLFYDTNKYCLVATTNKNYPGVPFKASPSPATASERYAFQMYATNNLYYIISNGGAELTKAQAKALLGIRSSVVGEDEESRIENENTATLSRDEIHTLIAELDDHISKRQIREMAEKQDIYVEL